MAKIKSMIGRAVPLYYCLKILPILAKNCGKSPPKSAMLFERVFVIFFLFQCPQNTVVMSVPSFKCYHCPKTCFEVDSIGSHLLRVHSECEFAFRHFVPCDASIGKPIWKSIKFGVTSSAVAQQLQGTKLVIDIEKSSLRYKRLQETPEDIQLARTAPPHSAQLVRPESQPSTR